MRILVITSEAPPIVSGISTCVGHLVDGLRARGHHVDILSSVTMKRLVVGEFRLSSFVLHWPRIAGRLDSYDVINLHGPVPTLSDAFLLLNSLQRNRHRRPVVYTHHSAIEIAGWEFACDVYNVAHKWLAQRADAVITTSNYYRDSMFSPSHRAATIVPWGVDPIPTTAHRSRQRGAPLRVLFVGQMRPYKGVDVLLDAVMGRTDITLTLVGSGPELPGYRRRAEEAGAGNVTFTGRVSDEELAERYAEHDVIVLPSLTHAEAFGLVVLEGMVNGAVPVVSDLPGVRDLAEGPGIVVPPNDADALRDALVRLASDPAGLERRSSAARRKAGELSWESCVDAYEKILLQSVRSSPQTRSEQPVDLLLRRGRGDFTTPVGSPPVAPRRFLKLLSLLAVPLMLAGCVAPPEDTGAEARSTEARPVVGTLLTSEGSGERDREAGVSAAMVELRWSLAEPVRGRYDVGYLRDVAEGVDEFRRAGRSVTLGLGLHYAPDWAFDVPGSRYVNQRGETAEQLNLVFNAELRTLAESYLSAVDKFVPLEGISAVRISSGGNAELLYPDNGSYWAFDSNAQANRLPASLPENPVPGWRPGEEFVAPAAARLWAQWYLAGLIDVAEWQREVVRRLGFDGYELILAPGVGMRPREYERAIREGLPDGLLGVGAVWHVIFARLAPSDRLVAYSTSVADGSGGNAGCAPDDPNLTLARAGVQNWAAVRWIRRIADEYGLLTGGENPGFGLPSSLNQSYVDPSDTGMMNSAFRLVAECRLRFFYWAHDRELRNGTASIDLFLRLTASVTDRADGRERS